jgi:hypothetical protein
MLREIREDAMSGNTYDQACIYFCWQSSGIVAEVFQLPYLLLLAWLGPFPVVQRQMPLMKVSKL